MISLVPAPQAVPSKAQTVTALSTFIFHLWTYLNSEKQFTPPKHFKCCNWGEKIVVIFSCFIVNCIFCSLYNLQLNRVSTIWKPGEEQPISIYHYHHLLLTHMRGHKNSSDLRADWICRLQWLMLQPLQLTGMILYSLSQSFGQLDTIIIIWNTYQSVPSHWVMLRDGLDTQTWLPVYFQRVNHQHAL